jgi:hypothetical protein
MIGSVELDFAITFDHYVIVRRGGTSGTIEVQVKPCRARARSCRPKRRAGHKPTTIEFDPSADRRPYEGWPSARRPL